MYAATDALRSPGSSISSVLLWWEESDEALKWRMPPTNKQAINEASG